MISRNDEPDHREEAFEAQIDGVRYAWTEDDSVYMHDPKNPLAREDGYVFIGQIRV